MLNAIHGVKLHAQYNTWIEALCSLLCMERSITLNPIHGVRLVLIALYYTWSEALCALLYMEWIYME